MTISWIQGAFDILECVSTMIDIWGKHLENNISATFQYRFICFEQTLLPCISIACNRYHTVGISELRLVTTELSINSPQCLLAKGLHCITEAVHLLFLKCEFYKSNPYQNRFNLENVAQPSVNGYNEMS